jgi:L-asparaginase II
VGLEPIFGGKIACQPTVRREKLGNVTSAKGDRRLQSNPVDPAGLVPLVEVWRGDRVESLHLGAVAVVDAAGTLVARAGDPALTTYLRSAAKPFQLLPLVECGAADHFGFGPQQLAVMAASHSGRAEHVETVRSILDRIGLPVSALQCGAHAPYDDDARTTLERGGEPFSALHNNCSGKHAGMLAYCVFNLESIENYLDHSHPLQQRIRTGLAELAGLGEGEVGIAIDGCSAPCFAMPLTAAARAFAQLTSTAGAGTSRQRALARIAAAMASHPDMVAGPGRFDTQVMALTRGHVVSKAGAEGYQCMALRQRSLGIAFKVADGQGSRTSGPIAIDVLDQLGALDDATEARDGLEPLREPAITNRRGLVVGRTRSVTPLEVI